MAKTWANRFLANLSASNVKVVIKRIARSFTLSKAPRPILRFGAFMLQKKSSHTENDTVILS